MQEFLDLFPRTNIKGLTKNTDSHVFEAMWILVFLFNYDNLKKLNQTRVFYESLESMDKERKTTSDLLSFDQYKVSLVKALATPSFASSNPNQAAEFSIAWGYYRFHYQ